MRTYINCSIQPYNQVFTFLRYTRCSVVKPHSCVLLCVACNVRWVISKSTVWTRVVDNCDHLSMVLAYHEKNLPNIPGFFCLQFCLLAWRSTTRIVNTACTHKRMADYPILLLCEYTHTLLILLNKAGWDF